MKESWDNIFGEVPDSFEERMRQTLASLEETPKVRRFRFPAGGLLAAAMLTVVLGVTALATNFFGLGSLTVADPYATPEATSTVIALQGAPESAEFRANARWMDYLSSLDLPAEAAEEMSPGEGYEFYTVFNRAMADELDAIVSEFGLRLHTSRENFFSEEQLNSLLRVSPFITDCSAISGYVYEDGSFQGYGANMADKCFEYQLGRYVKGSFSQVTLDVGNTNDYEEWIYTTACGVDVQLSMGPDHCVLLADLPGAFVAVNLLGGTAGNSAYMPEPVTRESLESFADMFDYNALS